MSFYNSIQVEISRREICVGGAEYSELVDFLNHSGFVEIWEAHTGEHVEVLFMRRISAKC